jgi:hypothetical protein
MRAYLSSLAYTFPGAWGFPYTRHTRVLNETLTILSTRARTRLFTPTVLMSHSHPTTTTTTTVTSSSNFQLIFNNALKAYEKRTRKDPLAHPLASELEHCNSPAAILAVLHKQAQGLDRSPSSGDRWTKWLDPTVNVLHTFSDTLGEGVSLVSFRARTLSGIYSLNFTRQVFSPAKVIFVGVGVLLSVRILSDNICRLS